MNRSKNLVVTLSDKNYLQRAKQLFSSIYFNSGWRGDYLLLVCDVPEKETTWFKQRGVLIERCKLLLKSKLGLYSPVVGSKIYLFQEKFKNWNNIIYLDSDIIVRGSLDKLTSIKGFAAKPENDNKPLNEQFRKFKDINFNSYYSLITGLKKKLDFKKVSFNAGVFAFNTDIIKKNTFTDFKRALLNYGKISRYGDQGVQNIFFYGKWQPLPVIYNLFPGYFMHRYSVPPEKVKGIVIHFADIGSQSKPWQSGNPFHKEWINNLKMAEKIKDFRKTIRRHNNWYEARVKLNFFYRESLLKLNF